jgi:hypothetical protein
VLAISHERVATGLTRCRRAAEFYERGLARLADRWVGTGEAGAAYIDPSHPYAADLDLFGPGSLYELLCTARTKIGQDTLARWLLAPALVEEARERQQAVAELRDRLDFREALALHGASVPSGVDFERLPGWGLAPGQMPSDAVRLVALAFSLTSMAGLILWALDFGRLPFLIAVMAQMAFAWTLRKRVHTVLGPVERRASDLAALANLLGLLEAGPFTSACLNRLQAELNTQGVPPSRRLARLAYLVDWLNAKHNQVFIPIALLLMWDTQFAFAVERWRMGCGQALGRWLTAVGDLEALGALATYAYENATDIFPDLLTDGPHYEGEGLAHPLLPRDRAVANDLSLGGDLRVLVISGSNMSGKSTFLRTVGVNAVLALAGAPVRARRLRLSRLNVGATLRIQDSLQAGKSRFYAEITRIRQLVDLAKGPVPLLFLLDEIFHGTNSHDRRQGAEAIVRGLVNLGAIGLVTTHDLALADVADHFAPQAANVHFADQFADGEIHFDYRMRPGVVRHSNALALMRHVGLEV